MEEISAYKSTTGKIFEKKSEAEMDEFHEAVKSVVRRSEITGNAGAIAAVIVEKRNDLLKLFYDYPEIFDV